MDKEITSEKLPDETAVPEKNSAEKTAVPANESLLKKLFAAGINYKGSLYFPVHRKERIDYIEEDLDNNGVTEIYVICTNAESPEMSDEAYLSDIRNFIDDTATDRYLLAVFLNDKKALSPVAVLPLKHRSVLSSYSVLDLSSDTQVRAVTVIFRGEDGLSENIVTVSDSGSYSVISMNNTLSEFFRIEDIDNDRDIEIISYENLFEEGLGYETFITLYELTDNGFSSAGTVNIVRNLKLFLSEAEKYLEAKNLKYFLKFTVPSARLKGLNDRGLSDRTVLQRIFYPVKKENDLFPDINMFLKNESNIDIVFPDIVENPFRFDRKNVYNFTTYVKVSAGNQDEAIYLVKIYMNSNPFDSPMFSFLVN